MELFYLWLAWEASTTNTEDPVSQNSDGISCPMDSKSTEGMEPWATHSLRRQDLSEYQGQLSSC